MRTLRWLVSLALIVALSSLGAEAVQADHVPRGLVATEVQRATITEAINFDVDGIQVTTEGPFDVVTLQGTFERGGGSAGWHSHPGPVFVVIRSGTLTVWDEHCTQKTYSQGEGFVELGPEHSMLVKNESGTEDVSFYATFIVPVGAAPLAVPEPHVCGLEE